MGASVPVEVLQGNCRGSVWGKLSRLHGLFSELWGERMGTEFIFLHLTWEAINGGERRGEEIGMIIPQKSSTGITQAFPVHAQIASHITRSLEA